MVVLYFVLSLLACFGAGILGLVGCLAGWPLLPTLALCGALLAIGYLCAGFADDFEQGARV